MDLVHVKRVFLGAVVFNRPILNCTHVGDDGRRQTRIEHLWRLPRDREVVVGRPVGTFRSFGEIKASGGSGFFTRQTSKTLDRDGGNLSRRNVVLRGNAQLVFLSTRARNNISEYLKRVGVADRPRVKTGVHKNS